MRPSFNEVQSSVNSACTFVSLSGSEIVPSQVWPGYWLYIWELGHNEPLHRSLQWTVHYRWQTEQSERRMLNNNAY